ncbi:MAG: TfoX/Sxy family protein [Alphaproteobacteria bacterium]|nr:TfoX/Sxy family protein [Alphaproteobacteria bacterium]
MPRRRRPPTPDRLLAALPGLGPASVQWLREVGIETEAELHKVGAVAAYQRLKQWNPKRVSLNMLWGLHGALTGGAWNKINTRAKEQLRAQVQADNNTLNGFP